MHDTPHGTEGVGRTVALFLLRLVALLAAASTARVSRAALRGRPPVARTSGFTVDEAVGNCGGFHILAAGHGTLRETLYFDNDGAPARLHVQARYAGTLTNSATGKAVTDATDAIHVFADLQRQTETYVGVFFNVNVPGEGVVALEVGRYVVESGADVSFIKGQFQVSEGGLPVLCSALE
jgi:hypothetical protein